MEKTYHLGDLVWAKIRGFSPWPGRVSNPMKDMKEPSGNRNTIHCIFFFGTNNYAWVKEDNMKPYFKYKEKFVKSNKSVSFKNAVAAIQDYIKSVQEIQTNFYDSNQECDDNSRGLPVLQNIDKHVIKEEPNALVPTVVTQEIKNEGKHECADLIEVPVKVEAQVSVPVVKVKTMHELNNETSESKEEPQLLLVPLVKLEKIQTNFLYINKCEVLDNSYHVPVLQSLVNDVSKEESETLVPTIKQEIQTSFCHVKTEGCGNSYRVPVVQNIVNDVTKEESKALVPNIKQEMQELINETSECKDDSQLLLVPVVKLEKIKTNFLHIKKSEGLNNTYHVPVLQSLVNEVYKEETKVLIPTIKQEDQNLQYDSMDKIVIGKKTFTLMNSKMGKETFSKENVDCGNIDSDVYESTRDDQFESIFDNHDQRFNSSLDCEEEGNVSIGPFLKEAERYKCNYCSKEFSKLKYLKVHITVIHNGVRFACDECKKTYTDFVNVKRHIEMVHLRIKKFKCKECKKRFSYLCELNNHFNRVHRKIKNYECFQCCKKFSYLHHLKTHIDSVHNKKTFSCIECTKSFSLQHSLKIHINSVHKGIRNYACKECDQRFTQSSSLNIHIKAVHRKIKNYSCNICEQRYFSIRQLQIHVDAVHKKIKNFECAECGKLFSILNHLKVHINNVHEGKRNYLCCECNKRFSQSGALRMHINVVHHRLRSPHMENKQVRNHKINATNKVAGKHKCEHCHKNFAYLGNLNMHIRSIHEGITFTCYECKKSFNNRFQVKNHIQAVHIGRKIFSCDKCNKKFCLKMNLKRHCDAVHRKIKHHECLHCGHKFFSPANLKKHVDAVHKKIKKFVCEECVTSFNRFSHLKTHIEIVHLRIKNYFCKECFKSFSQHSKMVNHVKEVHQKVKNHFCNTCGKGFFAHGDLRKHVNVVHENIKNYVCGNCNSKFSTLNNLKSHIIKVHNKMVC